VATELGSTQISTLLETLPGIANVLRSPVADALVNVIRAAARLTDSRSTTRRNWSSIPSVAACSARRKGTDSSSTSAPRPRSVRSARGPRPSPREEGAQEAGGEEEERTEGQEA